MLLARLQGEHKPAPTILIARLPGDPSRQPAQQRVRRGEEAKGRAAEVEPAAERLPLANREIDPTLARRLQDPEPQRVTRADRERSGFPGACGEPVEVLDRAQEVWLLHDQRAGGPVQLGRDGDALLERQLNHLHVPRPGQRTKRLARVGVNAARDDEPAP